MVAKQTAVLAASLTLGTVYINLAFPRALLVAGSHQPPVGLLVSPAIFLPWGKDSASPSELSQCSLNIIKNVLVSAVLLISVLTYIHTLYAYMQ